MEREPEESHPMIPIKNIYHMLTYAFRALSKDSYQSLATEEFDNIYDLYAAILIKGISTQLRRGLVKEYIRVEDQRSALKGRVDVSASIKEFTMVNHETICQYDEYSANRYMNQILKTTMLVLLNKDIESQRKKEIRKLLLYFSEVDHLYIHSIQWHFRFHRNNQDYQLLLSISRLIIEGHLQRESTGQHRLMTFEEEQKMSQLYEKFLLEYFRKEYPEIQANASHIQWQLDDNYDDLLPQMQSDVTLKKGKKILIIDAKYYTRTSMTQSSFNTPKNRSENLYQIFSYVKNKEADAQFKDCDISGMILYAQADEEVIPNNSYQMSGNRIDVQTLDLSEDFEKIEQQLEIIAEMLN